MFVLPCRLGSTSRINVHCYACLTISAGNDLQNQCAYYACFTISAGNDLRNIMCLIMHVLPYRLVMTSGINAPYYAYLTILAGNDLRNYCALLHLSYHIGW
jgi:hypothetical protein